MINNERSNNKMLNLFLVGLGVVFVAGGAYVIYKMQQNSQEKNKSTSSPNEKTRYKDYTIQGTSPESRTAPSPSKNHRSSQSFRSAP